MTSGFFTGSLLRGLAMRVLLFLSLALLPIGLIALVQTKQIADQSQANAELSLLAVTERISAAEERVIQEAFGAAEALGVMVALRHHHAENCSTMVKEYKDASGIYSIVGFIGLDGKMHCSSTHDAHDFSGDKFTMQALKTMRRQAYAHHDPRTSKRAVTVVNTPVFHGEAFIGLMSISIPFSTFAKIEEPDLPVKPIALMTFNDRGALLTTEKIFEQVGDEAPAHVSLAAFSGKDSSVFSGENHKGEERIYAVLPLVPDAVYAISVWPVDTPILKSNITSRLNSVLPFIMWVATLVVLFWALNRLAIIHIRKLGRQMRRFALNRMLPRDTLAPSVPTELVDMERAFIDMAESILRDEATLEDSLREKNILLKEVHHRVKNNLQLISSIMNMQIRQAETADSKFVLRRLQDRILSLATVHENLYKNDNLGRIDASVLLHETVNQLLQVGLAPGSNVEVTQTYEPITLHPDDAAPLTLMTSEAVTNALKYVSFPEGDKGIIRVDLTYESAEIARLTVENSAMEAPAEQGTGLGSKLIVAFTRQLNGQVEMGGRDGVYRLILTFPVPQQPKQVLDY